MNKIKQELIPWVYILVACILFSLLMKILINYPFFSFLRALLGMIYVLFLPGYVVVRLFFEKLDFLEKAALSFGLSIAIVILAVMFTNMVLRIPITALSNFLVLLAAMIITVVVKRYQKQIVSFFMRFKFWKSKPKPKKKKK